MRAYTRAMGEPGLDALRRSEERLHAVIESSPLAIVEVDPQARIIAWDPAAERIFGWTQDEMLGRPDVPMVPDFKRGEHEDLVAAVGTLESGVVTNHLVNWLSPFKERVTIITGSHGRSAFTRSANSMPSMPGILRSSRIRSGTCCVTALSKSSPDSKPVTACCRRDRRLTMAVRMAGSSSVT